MVPSLKFEIQTATIATEPQCFVTVTLKCEINCNIRAFRKWHSCETQLATVMNDWAKILDNKGQVDTFILDFEKAFDTPPHESKRKAMNRNWYNQKANPALDTKAGDK